MGICLLVRQYFYIKMPTHLIRHGIHPVFSKYLSFINKMYDDICMKINFFQ